MSTRNISSILRHPGVPRWSRMIRLASAMVELRRQRRALANLDDARLDDVGISPDAAIVESRKPIWDVPPTWRL